MLKFYKNIFNKKIKNKKFNLTLITVFIVVIFLVSVFNILIDPFYIFKTPLNSVYNKNKPDFKRQERLTKILDFKLDVLFSQFTQRTDDYTVEIWDGTAWVSVASGVANTEQDIWVSFTPVAADKVRFTVTQGQLYLKVYELEVYGND